MMNKLERWWMINRARRMCRKYDRRIEHFDCGREIAEHIRPDLYVLRLKIASIVNQLRADDKQKATAS